MYRSTDNKKRNDIYFKIMKMTKNKLEFIDNIFEIISSDYDLQTKLATSLFFKSFLNNLIIKKEISADERSMIFDNLTKI